MYAELKCKTHFSFLNGASSAAELFVQAHHLGLSALAVTDINGVYSLPRAYETIRDKKVEKILNGEKTEEAIKTRLICGAELNIKNHLPITLLACTRRGYGLLCRLLTRLHAGKEKGEGHLTFEELIQGFEDYPLAAKELIALPDFESFHSAQNFTDPSSSLALLKDLLQDRLYLPITRYRDGFDRERTLKAQELSQLYHIPIVATQNALYHHPDRRFLHDTLTCIRENTTLDQAGFLLSANSERYLKNEEQMLRLFYDQPDWVYRTQDVADQCQFHLSEIKYSYPHEFIPKGQTAQSYLRELVLEGAKEIYVKPEEGRFSIPEKVLKQINYELDFLHRRSDEHYFLTVHDIVREARKRNIYCQGRGSAANSIVCYCLGITAIDPIDMNLLFDRFMNEGRNEPPDIDVDFEHDRREEIIQYIYQRFGRDRAAMVAAVRTYRSKSAVLEIGKALGLAEGTLSASELKERIEKGEIPSDKSHRLLHLSQLTEELKSFPRHLSIHSGGFVLSDENLCEIVPIEPARMQDRTIVQWDKDDLEALGLMKIDVLSIGFLSVLHRACEIANVNWKQIPSDDKPTYAMIQRGETHGTFQIESRAQMAMLPQTLPENYYDLVVEVALVRPSPTKGGMVQPYIKGLKERRQGRSFKIGNTALEKILGRTCGVPIFQEQIMQISIEVAGFTPAEADQLRRSLAQMRTSKSVNAMGEKLRKALLKQNISKKFADDLFNYIQGYAHYGFPESHAASYASLAYKSAYLKCHHPAELLIGLINSQPMGFYPIDTLINEAKRNGVSVLPMHPFYSRWEAYLEAPKTVRMGLAQIRGLSQNSAEEMIQSRLEQPFSSFEDFVTRTSFHRDQLETLALAGFFDVFGLDRRHSFWCSLEFTKLIERKAPTLFEAQSQAGLFTLNSNKDRQQSSQIFTPLTLFESMSLDYKKTGYSLEGNLMKALRQDLPHLPPTTSDEVKLIGQGQTVRFAGILSVLQRPPPALGTAFITLEDDQGSVDIITKKDIYEKYEPIIRNTRHLIVTGKIQKKGKGQSLIATHFEAFSESGSRRKNQPGESSRHLPKLL